MMADFFDGPLEGVSFDVSECPDKLLILFDGGRKVRYECDQIFTRESCDDVCRMVLTRDADAFDEEISDQEAPRP